MKFDLAVVGAGVAGSVAAYRAASLGLKVVLIEKEKLPRYKTCGGAITSKTLRLLKEIGAEPPLDVLGVSFDKIKITTPYVEKTINVGRARIFFTYRDKFDYFLTKKAEEAGARLLESAPVVGINKSTLITAKGEKIEAEYIVGADGFSSVVALNSGIRRAFPKNQVAIAAEYEIAGEKASLPEIHFGYAKFGYYWIFPKQNGTTIGVGELASELKGSIFDVLQRYALARGFTQKGKLRAHAIPMGGIRRRVQRGNILLAGDAAGFVEPLSGEGTYYAALSGKLAAECVAEALEGKPLKYQSVTDKEILPDLRALLILSKLLHFNIKLSSYLLDRSNVLDDVVRILIENNPKPRKYYKKAIIHFSKYIPGYIRERVL